MYKRQALGPLGLAALFLGNIVFVFTSRVTLLVMPLLALLLGWRYWRWRGVLGACLLAAAIGTGSWFASPVLRARIASSISEIEAYRLSNEATSIGMHTAFLKESLEIVVAAPLLGHGTGSIAEQFRQVTAQGKGASSVATVNPHNQTFAVAIQLGILGAAILWAMWIAHLLLFRGAGLAAWIGLIVVAENVVSSAVHSHLFDFANGWLYVLGVGVLGGMVLRDGDGRSANPRAAESAFLGDRR